MEEYRGVRWGDQTRGTSGCQPVEAEMEEAIWKLDSALMGGIPGKGVDDAAHNLGVLLGKARRRTKNICGMSVDIRKPSLAFGETSCGPTYERNYQTVELFHGSRGCMKTLMAR